MGQRKQSFILGAFIISLGGFVSKLLGAIYRVPLVKYLGGTGMGIYQMVYPLYCILLTVSASGIPTGIARLISSNEHSGAEKKAFFLYGGIGFIGALVMFAFSGVLASLQGEEAVEACCRLLAPSVLFVGLISVVRGYFQGKGNMTPTALTEIMEQVIKVCVGVALASRAENVYKATQAAVFAVTVSEAVTAVFALFAYLGSRKKIKPLYRTRSVQAKAIFAYTVPLTLTAIALPVSQLAESVIAVNLLRRSAENATAIYGVFSGCAVTIINLPVSLCYGLAAASVPLLSPLSEKGDYKGVKSTVRRSLLYTLYLSVPCAVGLFIFAPLAARLLFGSLGASEKELLISLVRIMAVNAVTSSLVQTSSACITSLGKPLFGTLTQWSSAVLRVGLSYALIAFTPAGITGLAISANCCYLFALVLNICYIIRVITRKDGKKGIDNADRIGNSGGRLNAFGKGGAG